MDGSFGKKEWRQILMVLGAVLLMAGSGAIPLIAESQASNNVMLFDYFEVEGIGSRRAGLPLRNAPVSSARQLQWQGFGFRFGADNTAQPNGRSNAPRMWVAIPQAPRFVTVQCELELTNAKFAGVGLVKGGNFFKNSISLGINHDGQWVLKIWDQTHGNSEGDKEIAKGRLPETSGNIRLSLMLDLKNESVSALVNGESVIEEQPLSEDILQRLVGNDGSIDNVMIQFLGAKTNNPGSVDSIVIF